ncbi:MAG: GAF domain-containing sensor histidine kinase [Bacteroidia bacterium]
MESPHIPENESERLEDLRSFDILDTLPEDAFDAITFIAAQICGTPISLVSLIDVNRQWFKSSKGINASETPRDVAFCAHAINNPEKLMLVNDASKDERFFDNPLVQGNPNIRFYAGAPLVSSSGFALGTLCVIDTKPNELNDDQKKALTALSDQVIAQLELRRSLSTLKKKQEELELKTEELSRFAHLVSHDLKSPLRGMAALSEMIFEESNGKLSNEAENALVLLKNKAEHAFRLVDGILNHTLSGQRSINSQEIILEDFIEKVISFCSPPEDIHVITDIQVAKVLLDSTLLHQIIQNLVSNAIKYNDKQEGLVRVTALAEGKKLMISVSDNGPGIPDHAKESIFKMFFKLQRNDRYGVPGTGIGLNTVKRLVEIMNAEILVESSEGEGTEFIIRIPDAIIL